MSKNVSTKKMDKKSDAKASSTTRKRSNVTPKKSSTVKKASKKTSIKRGSSKMAVLDELTEVVLHILESLKASSTNSLSRQEILELVPKEYEQFYSNIVQSLADMKLVVRNRGYYGGVTLLVNDEQISSIPESTIKRKVRSILTESINVQKVEREVSEEESERLEREMYGPLKDYLEKSGLYELVVANPKLRGGGWANADLAAVSFERELKYHSHIDLRLTAFEVKRTFPKVKDLQQTASYLVYSHAAYLCYYDAHFKGSNIDGAVQRLRDEGIWDLAEIFGIGLIVAYNAQKGKSKFYFQTVRHVPWKDSSPKQIEAGMDLWLDDAEEDAIRAALRRHIQRVFFTDTHIR